MIAATPRDRTLWWAAVAAALAAGLALRIAAAQGGLWTDEAWSVIYAAEAGDPAGVFLRINHDNNHHLYSLWLQLVGTAAPPWLARLPAILTGTAAIAVAAVIARRASAWAGVAAAVLFAVSPTLVTFGSEARGYALMLLAALVMILLVTSSPERRRAATPWWLALVAALGMLSHMTMAAAAGLFALWIYLERRSAHGPRDALRTTARLMGPALGATAAVVLFVFAAAAASPTGMRLGGYTPFEWSGYSIALDDLSGSTIGLSTAVPWLVPLLIGLAAGALAIRPPQWLGARGRLYSLLILGVPAAAALLQPGNAQFARYYLCSAVGLLLLAAELIGRGLARAGGPRVAAASALSAIVVVGLWHNSQLVSSQRGRPDGVVQILAQRSPAGARVALDPWRLQGMMRIAATRAGYPLEIADGCAPAEFLVTAQRLTAAPAEVVRCGTPMRAIGSAVGTPLTGDRWTLYRVQRLQTAGPPVSGPGPGASNRRLSSRAGVAQG